MTTTGGLAERGAHAPGPSGRIGYIPALDGLRALAVLAVFLDHSTDRVPGGFVGVDVFFVISGFLITSLLLREARADGVPSIRRFYMRRALRILPALAVCVALVLLLLPQIIEEPGHSAWSNAEAALLSYMNWWRVEGASGGAIGHLWSLAVEEQFYLVWVLVVWVLAANGRLHWLARVCILGIIAIGLWRLCLAAAGAAPARTYNGFDTRADAILYGCVLAVAPIETWRRRLAQCWIVPMLVLVAMLPTIAWDSPLLPRGGLTLISLAAAWLLVAAINAEGLFKLALEHPVAVWLGKRSYSFYLWHFPVLSGAGLVLPPALDHIPVKFALALALAELSYRLVERPFLRLKDRFEPKGRAGAVLPYPGVR